MMHQLRQNTKWIMLLVALAFVGLMFFEWGMDITGQSSGGLGEIGRVNGTPVMYEPYMATYRNIFEQVQASQEEPVGDAQNREIEDRAWEDIVTQILIQQELERRGILVSDDEVIMAARNNPPADMSTAPAFQTDGQFDLAKYQTFIANAEPAVLAQLEAYFRDIIPRGKLFRQLGSSIYVGDGKLWADFRDRNERATVSFVSFAPLIRVSDDQIEISEAEVARYYDSNIEDFRVPPSVEVISVAIPKVPTPEDSAAVLAKAAELRQQILDGADFTELAERESSDESTAVNGGDLGVFRKLAMVAPFDSAVFATRLNRVTEAVRTSFGVHLIEVGERWGQDSARARHILLPFERTEESEIALLETADSLEVLGEAITLTEAAAALGLETNTTEMLEAAPFIIGAGSAIEGGEWAFDPETSPGDVSEVFENRDAFYALELVSFDPGGTTPLEEAEPAVRASLSVEKKLEIARAEAEDFVQEVREGATFAETARSYALEIEEAGPFSRADFVSGLGRHNAATGAAFGLGVGDVSDVVEAALGVGTGNRGVFVLQLNALEAADSTAWLEQRDGQRAGMINFIRQNRITQWIAALREAADVVDRREEVLTPADEENPILGPPIPF